MCSFGSFFFSFFLSPSGSGFRDKGFSLVRVPNPGCASFNGSRLRPGYSRIALGLQITDLPAPGSLRALLASDSHRRMDAMDLSNAHYNHKGLEIILTGSESVVLLS